MDLHKKGDKISLQIEKLGLITLISSLAIALVTTIWAVYLESIIKNPSQVGLINTFFGIIGVIGFIIFIPFIEKNSKTRIFTLALITYALSYFLFFIFNSKFAIVILGAIIYLVGSLRISTLGIILRDKSKEKSVSKNTGFLYTMLNLSWLISAIVAGFLSQKFGFKVVFLISGILMVISVILFQFSKLKDNRTTKKIDKNTIKLAKEFFSKKKFIINYLLTGGISFWWAFIYIFIPIYIIESGKTNILVGYFLAGTMIPLIFLELLFGKIAGKSGPKKMFFKGYLILTFVSVLCFFTGNIYFILILLALGSIGMAMLEPTTEAYFFDITSQKERDKFYGMYNTTISINYAISIFIISILIKFAPFKYSFLVIGLFMLIFAIISLKTKNTLESKRKEIKSS
jgi:MFS family permease